MRYFCYWYGGRGLENDNITAITYYYMGSTFCMAHAHFAMVCGCFTILLMDNEAKLSFVDKRDEASLGATAMTTPFLDCREIRMLRKAWGRFQLDL